MNSTEFVLQPGHIDWPQLTRISDGPVCLGMDDDSWNRIERSHAMVRAVLEQGRVVYGINTGFGLLANKRIAPDQLAALQRNLVMSHAAGVGKHLDRDIVRLILGLKINCLAQGYSGVSRELVDRLLAMLDLDALPAVPEKGSVGASGDLAPLAHFSQTLIGEGHFLGSDGKLIAAPEWLSRHGLEPLELQPKEGLALLNGTQVSTAIGIHAFRTARNLFQAALIAGAMSVDAAMGSDAPFDPRIHAVRGHLGQTQCAAVYRQLLSSSAIRASHLECDRVQDPYSLRCQPQVMGACLDQMNSVGQVLLREANAVSDNPLVFPQVDSSGIGQVEVTNNSRQDELGSAWLSTGDILSGGNFHAEPVALACDNLALAISEIGALAERRISLLIDAHLSNLPPFLVADGGLNSGFMIPQVTACALASENKSLAHPASIDSLPTSANQEDHVSMATYAARRLLEMNRNTATIVAIELLAAAQGIDFRAPLQTSPSLIPVLQQVRSYSENLERDRSLAGEIEAISAAILKGEFALPAELGEKLFG